jgi:hypothetical protein
MNSDLFNVDHWIDYVFFLPNCIESPVAASPGAPPPSSSLFLLVHLELSPIHLKQPENTIVEYT